MYGYVERDDDDDDDDDDERQKPWPPFQGEGIFYTPYHIDMTWDGQAFDIPVCPQSDVFISKPYIYMVMD